MESWYYGLADCHGVESFVTEVDPIIHSMFFEEGAEQKVRTEQFALSMRAHANAHRHAVVYRVLIPMEVSEAVEKDIEAGKYLEALKKIKAGAIETQLGTYATTKAAAEKNWKMIPNPDLDPYHT
jgi:hypothetical protein